MIPRITELDFQPTPMGELTLRKRVEPQLGIDVFEVKLGDEFLMSSLFVVAEEELAHLGLAAHDNPKTVMVGGLGLGYTAVAALADVRVMELAVVETMAAVIDWHERELLPASAVLVRDDRTSLVKDDFFALMRREPERTWDAILLDVDHSTEHQLDPSHADLYTVDGLRALVRHLAPGGVFALWSDDPPEPGFEARLASVFDTTAAHVVEFDNFLTGGVSTNTVYVAKLG
jgi:spermidine synthase